VFLPHGAIFLALLAPGQPDDTLPLISPEDLPHQPFVELLVLEKSEELSLDDLKALRSRIEKERDQELERSRKIEEEWKQKLAADRHDLATLNKLSSADTQQTAKRRADIHTEIAALERSIREKALEREKTIPARYELQLTKLWLAEHWPEQRSEILERIGGGQARDRKHGDADDIGYRQLVKDAEKDVETGQQAARQMVAGGWLPFELQDAEVQTYVRQIAARIAANSDMKVPLHVTVLDSAEPRAIALPGGFLYLTSGVIRSAGSESEVAGVLSREIARIAARHATRTSKMSWVSRLFVPVTQIAAGIFTAGATSPGAYYGINYGLQNVGGLVGRALNGTNEGFQAEADQLGVQYAWKAGYDPKGFVAFLDSTAGNYSNALLTDEPPLRKRLLKIFSEIQYLPPQKHPLDSGDFDRIRQRVR
jgi:Zn-dependent protease with chaperone function